MSQSGGDDKRTKFSSGYSKASEREEGKSQSQTAFMLASEFLDVRGDE